MVFVSCCGGTTEPRRPGWQKSSFCRRRPGQDRESARRVFGNTVGFRLARMRSRLSAASPLRQGGGCSDGSRKRIIRPMDAEGLVSPAGRKRIAQRFNAGIRGPAGGKVASGTIESLRPAGAESGPRLLSSLRDLGASREAAFPALKRWAILCPPSGSGLGAFQTQADGSAPFILQYAQIFPSRENFPKETERRLAVGFGRAEAQSRLQAGAPSWLRLRCAMDWRCSWEAFTDLASRIGSMKRNGAGVGAAASWRAAALCRFRTHGCPSKAAEGCRTPKPCGASNGSLGRLNVLIRAPRWSWAGPPGCFRGLDFRKRGGLEECDRPHFCRRSVEHSPSSDDQGVSIRGKPYFAGVIMKSSQCQQLPAGRHAPELAQSRFHGSQRPAIGAESDTHDAPHVPGQAGPQSAGGNFPQSHLRVPSPRSQERAIRRESRPADRPLMPFQEAQGLKLRETPELGIPAGTCRQNSAIRREYRVVDVSFRQSPVFSMPQVPDQTPSRASCCSSRGRDGQQVSVW